MLTIDDDPFVSDDPRLIRLLNLYVTFAKPAGDAWIDRIMKLEGTTANQLSRLHGQLIAADWLEQQTGATQRVEALQVPGCYRVTPAGRKAAVSRSA